ncbi:hypothetical protein KX928_01020 [Roseobacter sp. YSTF-M11]|uniref:Uncharacterized protein n=1 Tax=Roseobacter insulae TaxID=2859783 RepID=A0A9X1K1B5_9RHOB|nr:hypothetical protein [Roseobacter insulae]MBW4706362.1 hypothetical protein [Roseobacter insulae]
MKIDKLVESARYAASSAALWANFLDRLREDLPVDRICAALRVDQYTAYLPRVAQIKELEPLLGGAGLYADREVSRTFDVIASGRPYLAAANDWFDYPDLAFYAVAVRSNIKLPVSFGGYPTVLNLWSREENAFTQDHLAQLAPIATAVSQSPFQLQLDPVGLALRRTKDLMTSREDALKAA